MNPVVLRKQPIVVFYQKYPIKATKEAFNVSRSTVFLWQKQWKNQSLMPKSKRPKKLRVPQIPWKIVQAVSNLWRTFSSYGKKKYEFY